MDAEGTPLAVLFADVSGSTSLYEKLGDSQALRLVNECIAGMRLAIAKHRGNVVKTVGDEVIATFLSADQALQSASDMQAALSGARPGEGHGLSIRIGLSFGPVLVDQADIFGDTVNLCSRVAGMANPGQILTTRQTVEALSPFLRSTCRKLYSTNVKGKAEKVAVFEVIWKQDQGITVVGGGPSTLEPLKLVALKLSYKDVDWVVDENRDALSVGRDPANDVTVATDKASRHHARIFHRGGKYVIADQSANGTYVLAEHRGEILLRREEYILTGTGRIGLGQSAIHGGEHVVDYEIR
jgi:adenylate cyclase